MNNAIKQYYNESFIMLIFIYNKIEYKYYSYMHIKFFTIFNMFLLKSKIQKNQSIILYINGKIFANYYDTINEIYNNYNLNNNKMIIKAYILESFG